MTRWPSPRTVAVITGCTLALLAGRAPAQSGGSTAYKCGEGQYSATPCPGGKALDVADPRSVQQQRDTAAAAQRDAAEADKLARERRARETAAAPKPVAGKPKAAAISASAPASSARKAKPDSHAAKLPKPASPASPAAAATPAKPAKPAAAPSPKS